MGLQDQNLKGNLEGSVRWLSNYEGAKIYENMYMTMQVRPHEVEVENKQISKLNETIKMQ